MDATKEELCEGRKRLFKLILRQARAAHRARQDAACMPQSSIQSTSSSDVSFLALCQGSFKFSN
jgi:hypothetical protein